MFLYRNRHLCYINDDYLNEINSDYRKAQRKEIKAGNHTSSIYGVEETKYKDKLSYRPWQGKITYDEGFNKKERPNEVKLGIWYRNTIGGNVHHLTEKNPNGYKNPDALTEDGFIEFKNVTSENGIDGGTRKGLEQISKYPNRVINDISISKVKDNKAKNIVKERMKRSEADYRAKVILKRGNKIISVLKRK